MTAKKSTRGPKPPPETASPAESTPGTEIPEQGPASPAEDAAEERQREPQGPPVAGIVASAGGLDAFKKFFTAMPPDSGVAFVLVPHLDPRHDSLMVELLARHTRMTQEDADPPRPAAHEPESV